MNKDKIGEYKKYLKEVGEYMAAKGYTSKPLPKVILDDREQGSDVFCYTGYFDPNSNAVRLFTNGRLMKDVLRTWAHELIHWKQQKDGDIERSGYNSDKITEDKNLIHLEGEAYLKGNMAFRSWTEEVKKRGGDKKMMNESIENQDGKFTPDVNWLEENYAKANSELFNGSLGNCDFSVQRLGGGTLGSFAMCGDDIYYHKSDMSMYKKTWSGDIYVDRFNFYELTKPMIYVNASYRARYDSWYNTLVHEMCHYYTYMYGRSPKRAHGREFNEIAAMVSSRSGGQITIQRLASAEEMKDFELDANVQAQIDRRKANRKASANYVLISEQNGKYRLVNVGNMALMRKIVESSQRNGFKMWRIIGRELTDKLFDMGYKNKMITYRYWTLSNEEVDMIFDDVDGYQEYYLD